MSPECNLCNAQLKTQRKRIHPKMRWPLAVAETLAAAKIGQENKAEKRLQKWLLYLAQRPAQNFFFLLFIVVMIHTATADRHSSRTIEKTFSTRRDCKQIQRKNKMQKQINMKCIFICFVQSVWSSAANEEWVCECAINPLLSLWLVFCSHFYACRCYYEFSFYYYHFRVGVLWFRDWALENRKLSAPTLSNDGSSVSTIRTREMLVRRD